jgi:sodium-dependent dicarboxylate transporter 2/3/5
MSLLFIYVTGFLLSRLSVRYGLAEALLVRSFQGRERSFKTLLLYLVVAAALMAMVMPNFLTALTLLPMLEALRLSLEQRHETGHARRLVTASAVIAMYGCNLGGIGSMVGSPANALILGAAQLFEVPGREKINYLSWFGWSLPLVLVLILSAWTLMVYFILPKAERHVKITLPQLRPANEHNKFTRRAWYAFAVWVSFWIVHALLQLAAPQPSHSLNLFGLKLDWSLWDQIATLFGLLFCTLVFAPIFKGAEGMRQAVLKVSDCFNKLPVLGFGFVLLAMAISGLFIYLKIPQWLAHHLERLVPQDWPPLALYLCLAFITTLATELLSNTTVSLVFFPIVHALALALHLPPLAALLGVGLASTNAFMLPIATPANALIYGGVKNISLKTMIASGLVMNLISSFWLAIFLGYVIPRYYGLH